jgi:hypothetical protein
VRQAGVDHGGHEPLGEKGSANKTVTPAENGEPTMCLTDSPRQRTGRRRYDQQMNSGRQQTPRQRLHPIQATQLKKRVGVAFVIFVRGKERKAGQAGLPDQMRIAGNNQARQSSHRT